VRALWVVLCLLWSTVAVAQEVHVSIVAVRGKGGGAQVISNLEGALAKLRGVSIEPSSRFIGEAQRRRLDDRVESDPDAMARVARALQVDSVVRGDLESGARTKDQSLTLTVYDGGSGRLLGEAVLAIPKGKFTPKHYTTAAKAIEPYLRQGSFRSAPLEPEAEPVVVAPVVAGAESGDAASDEEDDEVRPRGRKRLPPIVRVRGGLSAQSRSFNYRAETASKLFLEEGIKYESTLSPGFTVDAEVYPLAAALKGPVTGFGITGSFDKVFLETKQQVKNEDGSTVTQSLETRQSAARVGLRFRYGFEEHELSPEVTADVGMGWRVFELGQNDEYRGTNYRYWVLGVGGAVPLTTPLAILEAKFNYAPTADLAESTRELAAKADVIGFGFTAGLTSRFAPGWSASLLYDWQMFTLDLDGEGRGGRVGRAAEDVYQGVRLVAGWEY